MSIRAAAPLSALPVLLALLLGICSNARAQATGAAGAYERGELAQAIEQARRELRGDDLSIEEVARLLEIEALAALALGRDSDVEAALGILASVAPEHELSEEAPPRMRERLAALRRTLERPSVTSDAQATAGGVRITARPQVRSQLAPELAIRSRVGEGAWTASSEAQLDLPAGTGDVVEWYVTVHGIGGLLLAADGSEAEPRSFTVPGEAGGDDAIWIGLGVASGAVALGVVITILAVFFADQTRGTLIDPITIGGS